ncbi:hypothetical protein PBI_SCTP2_480 [Salicola phage SCTP-2]|nr:hypothetical protein PBI_SCTP2_480 [Salicola phage SCTP-2]
MNSQFLSILENEIIENPKSILLHKSLSGEYWDLAIQCDYTIWDYMENPSYEVLDYLVDIYPYQVACRFSHLMDEQLCKKAVCNHPASISFIENPSEDLQIMAVQNNLYAIENIRVDLTEKARFEAVKHHPSSILSIKNKNISIELMMVALDHCWVKSLYLFLKNKMNIDYHEHDEFRKQFNKLWLKNGPLYNDIKYNKFNGATWV